VRRFWSLGSLAGAFSVRYGPGPRLAGPMGGIGQERARRRALVIVRVVAGRGRRRQSRKSSSSPSSCFIENPAATMSSTFGRTPLLPELGLLLEPARKPAHQDLLKISARPSEDPSIRGIRGEKNEATAFPADRAMRPTPRPGTALCNSRSRCPRVDVLRLVRRPRAALRCVPGAEKPRGLSHPVFLGHGLESKVGVPVLQQLNNLIGGPWTCM
jgi:hypothetical protein